MSHIMGNIIKWNNWAVHESEEESDDEGPSVKSVEDSDASLFPLASDLEDINLDQSMKISVMTLSSSEIFWLKHYASDKKSPSKYKFSDF